jgi:hypothetical protein
MGRGPMTYLGQEQGTLTEGEGSVQLISSLRQLVCKKENIFAGLRSADLN